MEKLLRAKISKLVLCIILTCTIITPIESYSFSSPKVEEPDWLEITLITGLIISVIALMISDGDYQPGKSLDDSSSFALKYLLSIDQLDAFNNLSSEQERLLFNESWWKTHDPYSQDPQNELKEEFDNRVSSANQDYTSPYRRGWRTDQGRVLILHGKPAEKLSHPFATSFFAGSLHRGKYLDLEMWLYDESGEEKYLPRVLSSISGGRKFFLFGSLSGQASYQQLYSSELAEMNSRELFKYVAY